MSAEFEYLSGGVATGPAIAVGSGRLFGTDSPGFAGNDETFTRAGFLALGPDRFEGTTSLAGTYGTLSINNSGQWTYVVTNQTLGEGQSALDNFHLRLTDQFGLSSSQPLSITVNGANDAPVANNDFVAEVSEDDDEDLDPGARKRPGCRQRARPHRHHQRVVRPGRDPDGQPDGTVSYDATTSAQLQALNAGESLTDTFTYRLPTSTAQATPPR